MHRRMIPGLSAAAALSMNSAPAQPQTLIGPLFRADEVIE